MKTCEEYELAASCYVDGELATDKAMEFFDHLAKCEDCSAFMACLIRIRVEATREEKNQKSKWITSPAPFSDGMRTPGKVHRFLHSRLVVPVPVAVVVALLLVASALVFLRVSQNPDNIVSVRQAPEVQITTLPVVDLR